MAVDTVPPSILVVEHDPELGEPLVEQLAADGYRARLALTAEHARALARSCPPSLVILGDQESPSGALELLSEIRGSVASWQPRRDGRWPVGARYCEGASGREVLWWEDLPTIVVSSRAIKEPDLLRAFEAGADDFLAQPVGYLELRARLRALLGRSRGDRPQGPVRVGHLAIDPGARTVSLHGRPVELARLEYELLLHLARDPERVHPKQALMKAMWGDPMPRSARTIDSHASRLRRKLAEGSERRWVINVRCVGYRLI